MQATIKVSGARDAENTFDRLKEVLGRIVSAEIKEGNSSEKVIVLRNEDDEKIIFEGCFSAGYKGPEPEATYRLLLRAGFEITYGFVQRNAKFKLQK